jgi:hypothetical protein
MLSLRPLLVATLIAVSVTSVVAHAQNTRVRHEPAEKHASPSTMERAQNWSRRQWNAAKQEWRKDKAKWDVCNRQAGQRHLSGRKSWSYIYDCMKR